VIAIWLVYGLTVTEHQIWWLTLPSLAIVVLSFLALAGTMGLLRLREHHEAWCRTAILTLSLGAFISQTSAPLDLYPWQPDVKVSQRARGSCHRTRASVALMPAFPCFLALARWSPSTVS
jgi:hypothetical protein